jgi:hypothetical protein
MGSVVGMLTRYNPKTVTVITDDGQRWRVSPALLRRVTRDAAAPAQGGAVVPLRRK